jgi:hypothetical protein
LAPWTRACGQAWLALADAKSAGLLDRVDFIETADTRDRQPNISAFADPDTTSL